MKKLLPLFLLLFSFQNIYSQEKSDFLQTEILRQLRLKPEEINLQLYAEKTLPYAENQVVVVFPKIIEKDEDGNWYEYDSYIIVADKNSGKILQKFYEKNGWSSDAVVLSEITIDTGIYKINPQNRAFGIRVSYRGSSRANPYDSSDLSLFLVENKELKRILKNFTISEYSGEWDTRCAGTSEDVNSTITVDKKNSTKGFYDLIVKNSITNSQTFLVNDDCNEKSTKKTTAKKLKYNGKEYQ